MLDEDMMFGEPHPQTKASQPALFLVMPKDRQKGWITYGDRVVVLLKEKDSLKFRTGFVSSTPNSHVGIDNVSKVVIWCDQVLNSCADCADDAHEKSFEVNDPCLMKLDEIDLIRNTRLHLWFKETLTPCEILILQRVFFQEDFGLAAEQLKERQEWESFSERLNANLSWWREHGCPHPVYGRAGGPMKASACSNAS